MNTSRLRHLLMAPFAPLLSRLLARPPAQRMTAIAMVVTVATFAGAAVYALLPIWAALLLPAVPALPAIPLLLYYLFSAEFISKTPDHALRVVLNTLIGMSLASQLALQLKVVGSLGFGVIFLLTAWLTATAIASAYLMKE